MIIGACQPKVPPKVPTPQVLYEVSKAIESDIIFCVPAFVEVSY